MIKYYVVLYESFGSVEIKKLFRTEEAARRYIEQRIKGNPGYRDCLWFEDHEVEE